MELLATLLPPDATFAVANTVALAAWLALGATPPRWRHAPQVWRVTGLGLPLVGAVVYVLLLLAHWGPGGFGSLAEVRQLFDRPGLLAAGWLHYLAFDLFVGTWIARDAAERGVPRLLLLPCLVLTFLFGPAGLLAWFIVRLSHRSFSR
jgi:hypothetical protein